MEKLIEKAISMNLPSEFIQILKEKPMYPKEHCNHDIPEFGKMVKVNGKGSNNEWLMDFNHGYILGYMPASKEAGRPRGWYEVVFPSVAANGNPAEYVVGLHEEEFNII